MTKRRPNKEVSDALKVAIVGALATVAVAVIAGIFALLQRPATSSPTSEPTTAPASIASKASQRIDFNYSDSPTNHGWQILDSVPITFTSETDGYQGAYLVVRSNDFYAMDTYVHRDALSGTHIEFVSKFESDATVYAHVIMKGLDDSIVKEGWLKFYPDTRTFEQVDEDEWKVPVEAIPQGGGWSLFQIDLVDAVRQTFGNQGWRYAQIDRIRIRGNIALAYIEVYE